MTVHKDVGSGRIERRTPVMAMADPLGYISRNARRLVSVGNYILARPGLWDSWTSSIGNDSDFCYGVSEGQ